MFNNVILLEGISLALVFCLSAPFKCPVEKSDFNLVTNYNKLLSNIKKLQWAGLSNTVLTTSYPIIYIIYY